MGEGDTVTELVEVSANNNVAAEDKSEAFMEKKNAEKDERKEVEEESKEADEKDIVNMDIDKEAVKENAEKADQVSTDAVETMDKETAEKPDTHKEVAEDVANKQKEEKENPEEHDVEKGAKKRDKSESAARKKDRKRKRQAEEKKEPEPKTHEKDIENMDIDKKEVKENKDKDAEEKPETKFEVMDKETAEKPDKDKEEAEDVADKQKEEKESAKEHDVEKGSKKSDKSERDAQKKDRKRKRQAEEKKEPEPKTPLPSKIERPVRQRKSVERLVAIIEGEVTKEIIIEKGRGTALKDIPNVAYKLSKMKADDTLKLLHTILFGRRGKAAQFKSNISQFSGFVWHENEEKQKMKVKEKLNKCVKEKLLELCDVLDIPDAEDTSRKEDLESQLLDFLLAPYPTTSELLSEKDQSSKGKKRERASKKSPSSGSTKSKAEKKKKNVNELNDDQDEGHEVTKANGVHEGTDGEMSNQAESEEESGTSEEKTKKHKKKRKRSSNKERSNSKKNDNDDANLKVYSKRNTTETAKGKSSAQKKPSSKDNTGKEVPNGKGHKKKDKLWPSDKELRKAICEVLKEVDFNTATFTDIVQMLGKRYDTDLTPRKTSVKNMIQDELTRLADEAEADEAGDEENAEEDEKQPSVQSVEA
ncbi:hypothetical protein BC332_24897 [Capsicum chinense]|nr:hypothetical protein BC332_24897 [Capsicum chinense]